MIDKTISYETEKIVLCHNYEDPPAKFYCKNCDDFVVHYFFGFDFKNVMGSYRVKCDRCGLIHWMLEGKEIYD